MARLGRRDEWRDSVSGVRIIPWYTLSCDWARWTDVQYYAVKVGPVDFCLWHKGHWHLSVRWVGTQRIAWTVD